jgi:hypothetical protein
MEQQRIRVSNNSVEYGFSLELGERLLSLAAIRATKDAAAMVIISIINPETETEEYVMYSSVDFLALLKEVSLPFLEALGA